MALRGLLDERFPAYFRPNLRISVHPSPVLVTDSSSEVDSPGGCVGFCWFRCVL